ncbi:MAG: YbaB/EbfC family nucleoid-associated protein [Actinomycetia bacterium]|nr:YbaB/EbfC family nucleoid-associated protein [Actinomycetes bacterium]
MENFNINDLMAQAQAMQSQLSQAQEKLESSEVTGTSGGGLVTATVKGTGELVGLVIKPEACDPEDTETLADLVVAAVRDASGKASGLQQAFMPQMPNLGI